MQSFENYELGRTDETVKIKLREENQLAVVRMAEQCKRSMDILSGDLDPDLFDKMEFLDAAKKMILANRRTKIRILVLDTKKIVTRGHRLINLARTLSSFIDIRVPGEEHMDFNEMLFVADTTGYIHRLYSERFDATVNFNDKRVSKHLIQQFDEIWEKASQDTNLRQITL